MTTRVVIISEIDSNPRQRLVIEAHGVSGGDVTRALGPGEQAELWLASGSRVLLSERELTPEEIRSA